MTIVTPSQMRDLDNDAINRYGIPGIVLMENAAIKVVEEIGKTAGRFAGLKAAVFAGGGNNGGDAFAVARHLMNKGSIVKVFIIAARSSISGDALTNLNILQKMGAEMFEISNGNCSAEIHTALGNADIVIDGIFGTGLKGDIGGTAKQIIEKINLSGKPVIAIDIPSGIDGGTGRICGLCTNAVKTVTFGFPKIGLLVHPGCEHTGELVVADISIPASAVGSAGIKSWLIDADMVSRLFESDTRSRDSNKGDYGKVLLIAGSRGMTGAGCLAAEAALRSGAGLVYAAVPASESAVFNSALKEMIVIPVDDKAMPGYMPSEATDMLPELLKGKTVVAAGPGLSMSKGTGEFIAALVERCDVPLVLDADALNVIAANKAILRKLKPGTVLTPHPGEMARLTGKASGEVQADRIRTALDFAAEWGVIVVLKGARTIISCPDGSYYINPTGNPGMATGGAGDVLAGMIAGFAAQWCRDRQDRTRMLANAAIAAVYLHGLAGDLAVGDLGEYSMIAGDILRYLPHAFSKVGV